MKKVTLILITFTLLLSLTACGATPFLNQTPTPGNTGISETPAPTPSFPTYPEESVSISDLSEFAIVYPSYYDDYRIKEAYFLRDVIKNITGFELEVISDGETPREREIILASSNRTNGIEDSIERFESGLDYTVGVRDGNIVLGGNNFYADIRAIYDFINNILGYNDIDGIAEFAPKKSISGVTLNIYREPLMTIYACNYSVSPFTEQYVVRDMYDAHFNMVAINAYLYSDEELLDFIKWCSRYGIIIILNNGRVSVDTNMGLYKDCPVIWGHVIKDEPHIEDYQKYSDLCDEYLRDYGKYGWKPFVNFFGMNNYPFFQVLIENADWFDTVPIVSFDHYFGHNLFEERIDVLVVYEMAKELANLSDRELWTYIESYNITNRAQNTSKMFRWQSYVSLCFGAKGILYFQYGDCSPNYTENNETWYYGSLVNWDYSKNPAWYDAKEFNEELIKISDIIYNQYENVGAYTINCDPKYISVRLENSYPYFGDVITDFKDEANESAYLIGCFDKIDGEGNAFILINIDTLDDIPYNETTAEPVKIKLNGENVNFYREGELKNVEMDSDGYYLLEAGNGHCWFVTVE